MPRAARLEFACQRLPLLPPLLLPLLEPLLPPGVPPPLLPDVPPLLPGDDGLVALPLVPDEPLVPPSRWQAATLRPIKVARTTAVQVECLRITTPYLRLKCPYA
ncbi:MAG: hypothetical protein ACJ8LN_17450, partial [Sulfurifustis sp.]